MSFWEKMVGVPMDKPDDMPKSGGNSQEGENDPSRQNPAPEETPDSEQLRMEVHERAMECMDADFEFKKLLESLEDTSPLKRQYQAEYDALKEETYDGPLPVTVEEVIEMAEEIATGTPVRQFDEQFNDQEKKKLFNSLAVVLQQMKNDLELGKPLPEYGSLEESEESVPAEGADAVSESVADPASETSESGQIESEAVSETDAATPESQESFAAQIQSLEELGEQVVAAYEHSQFKDQGPVIENTVRKLLTEARAAGEGASLPNSEREAKLEHIRERLVKVQGLAGLYAATNAETQAEVSQQPSIPAVASSESENEAAEPAADTQEGKQLQPEDVPMHVQAQEVAQWAAETAGEYRGTSRDARDLLNILPKEAHRLAQESEEIQQRMRGVREEIATIQEGVQKGKVRLTWQRAPSRIGKQKLESAVPAAENAIEEPHSIVQGSQENTGFQHLAETKAAAASSSLIEAAPVANINPVPAVQKANLDAQGEAMQGYIDHVEGRGQLSPAQKQDLDDQGEAMRTLIDRMERGETAQAGTQKAQEFDQGEAMESLIARTPQFRNMAGTHPNPFEAADRLAESYARLRDHEAQKFKESQEKDSQNSESTTQEPKRQGIFARLRRTMGGNDGTDKLVPPQPVRRMRPVTAVQKKPLGNPKDDLVLTEVVKERAAPPAPTPSPKIPEVAPEALELTPEQEMLSGHEIEETRVVNPTVNDLVFRPSEITPVTTFQGLLSKRLKEFYPEAQKSRPFVLFVIQNGITELLKRKMADVQGYNDELRKAGLTHKSDMFEIIPGQTVDLSKIITAEEFSKITEQAQRLVRQSDKI